MVLLHFCFVNRQLPGFTIEVPDTATLCEVCGLIAERQHFSRSGMRLVFHKQFLQESVTVSSLTTTPEDPIVFHGKSLAPPPEPAKPVDPPAPPAAPEPVIHPDPSPADSPLDILISMGYDREAASQALQHTGRIERAIDLLSGKLVPQSRAPPPLSPPEVGPEILSDPAIVATLKRGEVAYSAAGRGFVSPRDAELFSLNMLGKHFVDFEASDLEKLPAIAAEQELWKFATMKAQVDEMRDIEQLAFEDDRGCVVLQAYYLCDKNLERAVEMVRALKQLG
jgi:hypothetical protein